MALWDVSTECESEFQAGDGKACVDVTGLANPITYEWDNGDTTRCASDLTTGWHFVSVTYFLA